MCPLTCSWAAWSAGASARNAAGCTTSLRCGPKRDGVCDDDGAPLIVRKDDREDVIRERLRTYEELTRPVLNHYPSDRYFQISGDRSSAYIFEEITDILETVKA